jgi:glycerol-3-phosphate acyltransferase PlsY
MILFFILFIFAYIAGSINFSILLFKILRKEDPRSKFSGNAGATNVYRQAGIYWAIVVFVFDMSRAVGIAFIALILLPRDVVPFIGFGLILGNRFPCFHGFKGGKGVANYFGFSAALTPLSAIIGGLVWLAVYAFLRVPFISSFCMVTILAAGTLIDYNLQPLSIAGVLITAVFIIISHRKNIVEHVTSKDSA